MDFSAPRDLTYSTRLEKCLAEMGLSEQNKRLVAAVLAQDEHKRVHDESNDHLGTFLGTCLWTTSTNDRLSTREHDQPEKALPELPVEVWNIIIDLATYVPGAFDVHNYSAIAAFTFDDHGIYARSRFETAMRDNSLCLSNGEQASAIAEVLRHGQDVGEMTSRIDLALQGSHDWTEEHTRAMICIFQSCPNLVCFSTAFCDPDPWVYSLRSLIGSLAHHKKFRRLEVKGGEYILQCIDAFLQDLKVLWCLSPAGSFHPPSMNNWCHLPQLRALVVSGIHLNHTWKLRTPSLRAWIMREGASEAIVSPSEQIEYLSVDCRWPVNSDLWRGLQTLTVKYIELGTHRLDWVKEVQHLTLRCIVIEDVANDFLEATWPKHLEENLQRIVSPDVFPHLQCVRIHLSFMMDRLAELESNIRFEWLRSCVRRGIRIEMLQGNMERSGDEWKILSRDRLNDLLFPPGF